MAIFDLFSKRQKRLRGEGPDVYVYDHLPDKLRAQIVHIVRDAIGQDTVYSGTRAQDAYQTIIDVLCREYGLFKLNDYIDRTDSACNFFLQEHDTERVLDFVEIAFRVIDFSCRQNEYQYNAKTKLKPDDAIEELNARLREHGIGYQYESGEIVRVDSQILHSEAVKPALALLSEKRFAGPNAEFLKAHEHYRHGRHEEAINECLKALESTLKVICAKRKWPYKETDQAKTLLEIVFSQGLIPSYLQSEFGSLRSTLESGVPTVRNKQAGHGQGTQSRNVPDYLAAYVLHLTASTILLLVNADKALP